MSDKYYLNRLKITGKLNEKTPSLVIIEILQSHNISLNKKITNLSESIQEIQNIEKYKCDTLTEPFCYKDYRALAFFVNHDSNSWTKSVLLQAYEHMFNFDVNDLSNIIYGQKTYDNPYVYNGCMLYKLCKHYSIETQWNMTAQTMINSLKQYTLSLTSLQEQISGIILKMNKSNLINMINSSNIKKSLSFDLNETAIVKVVENKELPPILNFEENELKQSLNLYSNRLYLLSQISPKNHYDAMILAALIYNVNIVNSLVPFSEYDKLIECKSLSLYIPMDIKFKDMYCKNFQWFNLNSHWEPRLNFIYENEQLRSLCILEGFSHKDYLNHNYETLLQMSRTSTNVYYGKNIYSNQENTPINLDEINDLHNDQCLTIGILETKNFTTYSMDEIATYFATVKEFKNPTNEMELFEERVINKIRLYAANINHTKMLTALEIVENWKNFSNENTQKLREIYNQNNNIAKVLNEIMEAGLYMRGWKITSEFYPLLENDTKLIDYESLLDTENKLEENVNNSIITVFDTLKNYTEEEQIILNSLPLMKFCNSSNEKSFIITPDIEDGDSIFERLKFVSEGSKYMNNKSCIRLSSNILLMSAYYYLVSLDQNEPFDITKLEHIT